MTSRDGTRDLIDTALATYRAEILPDLPPEKRYVGAMIANAAEIARRRVTSDDPARMLLHFAYGREASDLGRLARDIRTEVEQRLKAGRLRAIVATSSLEMGIDVGDLDEVVLVQSPPTIAATLQRVGRAGHRVGDHPRPSLERDQRPVGLVRRGDDALPDLTALREPVGLPVRVVLGEQSHRTGGDHENGLDQGGYPQDDKADLDGPDTPRTRLQRSVDRVGRVMAVRAEHVGQPATHTSRMLVPVVMAVAVIVFGVDVTTLAVTPPPLIVTCGLIKLLPVITTGTTVPSCPPFGVTLVMVGGSYGTTLHSCVGPSRYHLNTAI